MGKRDMLFTLFCALLSFFWGGRCHWHFTMTARRRAKGASGTQELSEAELAAQREATARKEKYAFEYTGAKEATKLARRLANASKGDVELKNRLASAERTERVAYGRTLDADDQQKRIRRFVINKFDAIRDAAGEFLESSSNGATITYMVFAYTKSVTGIVTQHSSILVPNMKDNLAKVRDVKDIAFSFLSNPDNFCKPDFDINMVHMDKQCSLLVSSGALDHLVKAYDPKDTSASIDVLRRSLAKGLKEFMPRPPLKPAPHVSPDAADVRFAEEQAAKAKRATGDGRGRRRCRWGRQRGQRSYSRAVCRWQRGGGAGRSGWPQGRRGRRVEQRPCSKVHGGRRWGWETWSAAASECRDFGPAWRPFFGRGI